MAMMKQETIIKNEDKIAECNKDTGLNIQLAFNETKAFTGMLANGKFSGVANKGFSMVGYTQMDLGIAKYHFEVGAGKENFEWV